MKMRKRISAIFAAALMLVLVLDGQTALEGARDGVDLCIRMVVPSLFPFFFLSGVFINAIVGADLSVHDYLGRFFSIPKGLSGLLVCGFLGGYPMGARCIGQLYKTARLSKSEAQRLLRYCSNAGPAFLFGIAGTLFPEKWMAWVIWLIHIASAWLVSLSKPVVFVSRPINHAVVLESDSPIVSSLSATLRVCGWVVLFRVLISFLRRWVLWILPVEMQVAAAGLLDLTNGCFELSRIRNVSLRFVLCSGMLAWGGLCVTMQTASVVEGLSLTDYVQGKALQTILSLLLSAGLMYRLWILFPCIALVIIILKIHMRKNSSFLQVADV